MNSITIAHIQTVNDARLTYANPVDASLFLGGEFESSPSSEASILATQISPNVIDINFPGDISTDTQITYSGTVPGIETPQTVIYT